MPVWEDDTEVAVCIPTYHDLRLYDFRHNNDYMINSTRRAELLLYAKRADEYLGLVSQRHSHIRGCWVYEVTNMTNF